MGDIFGRVITVFLAAAVFFGMPLLYMHERSKTACQIYILSEVTHFVDSVCNLGYVDRYQTAEFYDALSKTGRVCRVKLLRETLEYARDEERGEYVFVPVYYDEDSILEPERYDLFRGDFFKVTVTAEAGGFYFPFLSDNSVSVAYQGTVRYEAL